MKNFVAGEWRTEIALRWRERLRELVAETVEDEAEVQDELGHVIASVNTQR